jgi:hypothetical protein
MCSLLVKVSIVMLGCGSFAEVHLSLGAFAVAEVEA